MRRIAYLPGDGIGPEVLGVARRVLEAAGFEAEWVELPIGWKEWCENGEALPPETLKAIRTTEAGLFGAITSKPDEVAERELAPPLRGRGLRYRSPILRLRQELDLWANIRPVRTMAGRNAKHPVDLVLFRENTEGLYSGVESAEFTEELRNAWATVVPPARLPAASPDTAVSLRVVTRAATERIIRAAFDYAQTNRRRRVTLVEKSNVLRATGGLVRTVFHEVAGTHPTIKADELHMDAACAQLVKDPTRFDVVVATNLFGDIFSDVAAEVAGGLPLATSCNQSETYALFEPVHGSAPDIAGRGVANPLGAVLAGAWLARRVGQAAVAAAVESAVERVVTEADTLSTGMEGSASTREVEHRLLSLLSGLRAVPP